LTERVARVRSFSRLYTRVIGVLEDGLLATEYSLTEARVLFELAQQREVETTTLRERLGLDAGYLSRLLSRLDADGLIERRRGDSDSRRQVVRLTPAGRAVARTLDERSSQQVLGLLGRLAESDQRRLVAAMDVIDQLLGERPQPKSFVLRPFRSGDYGWVVHRHGLRYAEEHGWDISFEALVARIVADYIEGHTVGRDNAWIAEVDGEPVGCVFCVRATDETARLRLLLVDPAARGLGIGARLVDECVRFARQAGYRELVLWTNDVLAAARRIYENAGFELVDSQPHTSFGHDLVGQDWRLAL
jgi:DNA-binding MarR family transcriptional regulator/GNAT superfamily N-acetyltransferase